jgi:hypothetical protein
MTIVEELRDRHRDLLSRCRFPNPGTPVVCGVSGGADSLALLVLAVAAGCRVTAVHVDHGLREGSQGEIQLVAEVAERFGADFRSERVVLEPGPNLEVPAPTVSPGSARVPGIRSSSCDAPTPRRCAPRRGWFRSSILRTSIRCSCGIVSDMNFFRCCMTSPIATRCRCLSVRAISSPMSPIISVALRVCSMSLTPEPCPPPMWWSPGSQCANGCEPMHLTRIPPTRQRLNGCWPLLVSRWRPPTSAPDVGWNAPLVACGSCPPGPNPQWTSFDCCVRVLCRCCNVPASR